MLLNYHTNQRLLANVAQVLGECAYDLSCMAEMEEHDAVRLIWSLLKNSSTIVQANAAWALVPCVQNATVCFTVFTTHIVIGNDIICCCFQWIDLSPSHLDLPSQYSLVGKHLPTLLII